MNINSNIDDKLFYLYGVKPLEKEFANFEKKVCQYLMETHGFTKAEAFMAWQTYKMNVKLLQLLNPMIFIEGGREEVQFPLVNGSVQLTENTSK